MKLLSEKTKKTIVQLIKEFWIPFSVATAWTVSVLWGKSVDFQSVGTSFGPAFFFASWMTGQIFRVRKQSGVESSLLAVEARIHSVTERLESQTRQFLGHVTGGPGYCYIHVGRQNEDESLWLLVHEGPYPMYSINVRIEDLDTPQDYFNSSQEDDRAFCVPELAPGQGRVLEYYNLGSGDARNFKVYMSARNGTLIQIIKFRRIDGTWTWATQVETPEGIVHSQIGDHFPKDSYGSVDWE